MLIRSYCHRCRKNQNQTRKQETASTSLKWQPAFRLVKLYLLLSSDNIEFKIRPLSLLSLLSSKTRKQEPASENPQARNLVNKSQVATSLQAGKVVFVVVFRQHRIQNQKVVPVVSVVFQNPQAIDPSTSLKWQPAFRLVKVVFVVVFRQHRVQNHKVVPVVSVVFQNPQARNPQARNRKQKTIKQNPQARNRKQETSSTTIKRK